MSAFRDVLLKSPVMPVVTLSDPAHGPPLARALLDGGLGAIEITLRTAAGLEAIRRIAAEVPAIAIGAGTVLTPKDAEAAIAAGARFLVSPGLTDALAQAAKGFTAPLLPGVATPSEIMRGLDAGIGTFKLFPAEVVGGVAALKAFAGPFPNIRFCPTGGISAETAPHYLALPNVLCVGGSWVTPDAMIAARDWGGITRLARVATALRPA